MRSDDSGDSCGGSQDQHGPGPEAFGGGGYYFNRMLAYDILMGLRSSRLWSAVVPGEGGCQVLERALIDEAWDAGDGPGPEDFAGVP